MPDINYRRTNDPNLVVVATPQSQNIDIQQGLPKITVTRSAENREFRVTPSRPVTIIASPPTPKVSNSGSTTRVRVIRQLVQKTLK
jgi:hypothetical protein